MKWSYAEIEDQIVSLVIKDRNFSILVLGELEPDHFENETVQIIYKLIVKYFIKYRGIPTLEETKSMIVAAELEDRFDYLLAEKIYTQDLTPSTIDFIRDNIPGFIKFNKFSRMIRESSIRIPVLEHDEQEDFFREFSQKFKKVMLYDLDRDMGMDLFDVDRRYMMLKHRAQVSIRPHLNGLGKVIGGYAPKELYAYIGPPGVGKSIMLATDAFAAVQQGFNVVYFTMEMSPELFGLRLDMGLVKKTSKDLLQNVAYVEYLKKRYEQLQTTTKCGRMFIKEYPTGAASTLDFDKYLEMLRMYKDFTPNLIVVDYGDIMKPNGKRSGNRYEDQGMVFMELRAFAKTQGLPVLTAMQTNRPSRENMTAVISEDRIADSYDKLRTLDGCFSINPKYSNGEQILNEFFVYVIKNRNNRKDVRINFTMNKELMYVNEPVQPLEEDGKPVTQEDLKALEEIREQLKESGTLGTAAETMLKDIGGMSVNTETGEIVMDEVAEQKIIDEAKFDDMDARLAKTMAERIDEAEEVF